MKKAFVYFTFVTFAWTTAGTAHGQISNGVAVFTPPPFPEIIPQSKQPNSSEDSGFIFRNEININAVRNFIREYKHVHDTRWFKSANGLLAVCFTSDGVNSTIYFNKGRIAESMIRYNNEEKLPREVRHLIKSNYYDFSIFHITEITINRITVYVVTIENKNSKNKIYWKIIKVVNGEMEVLQEYSQNIEEEN